MNEGNSVNIVRCLGTSQALKHRRQNYRCAWGNLELRDYKWDLYLMLRFKHKKAFLCVVLYSEIQRKLNNAVWQTVCVCVHMRGYSVTSDSLRPHGLYVARQVPNSIGFSRQVYWSGLLFLPSGDLLDPGIPWFPAFPALVGGFFIIVPPGKPIWQATGLLF